jgi:predicted DNA-binding transcriptional regulator AlpA
MSSEQANRQSDPDAFSIQEFCERHGISQSFYHKIKNKGLGPRTLRLGSRVLITKEAARAWRRRRTTASSATTA